MPAALRPVGLHSPRNPSKPNAVRRGTNRHQTPRPALDTRGLTAFGLYETGIGEGLPVPREPALLAERSHDQSARGGSVPGEARAASSERRAGCPQQASGDGAWATPSGELVGADFFSNLGVRRGVRYG